MKFLERSHDQSLRTPQPVSPPFKHKQENASSQQPKATPHNHSAKPGAKSRTPLGTKSKRPVQGKPKPGRGSKVPSPQTRGRARSPGVEQAEPGHLKAGHTPRPHSSLSFLSQDASLLEDLDSEDRTATGDVVGVCWGLDSPRQVFVSTLGLHVSVVYPSSQIVRIHIFPHIPIHAIS